MTELTGRFTEPVMTAAMRKIADDLGVPSDDARLLRLTNNAVFALPTVGLVIRINRSFGLKERVFKVVQLAKWFAEVEAATVRLFDGIDQPLSVDNLLVTVWRLTEQGPIKPNATDLGHTLRAFHGMGRPAFDLPMWNPVDDARDRLADAEALGSEHRDTLIEWCDLLEPQVRNLMSIVEVSLVHGDAHASNLIRDVKGNVYFCDFDSTCLGPWQADLAAVPVGESRFGRPGGHRALADAYGYDITQDPNWRLFKNCRELKMAIGALPYLTSGPRVRDEFELRLRTIVEDSDDLWTPFAELR